MRLQINLAGLIDNIDDVSAVPYLLKMYLREVEKLPIDINPLNPGIVELTSENNYIKYSYHLIDDLFYLDIELTPKE